MNSQEKIALIIAGVNKTGTTSLFRALSTHHGIAPSDRKELDFFSSSQPDKRNYTLSSYVNHFSTSDDTRVLLEASPRYLAEGVETAERINEALATSRLVFLLRDPTERLRSYYRSTHTQPNSATFGVSFGDFVERAMHAQRLGSDSPDKWFGTQILRGHYAQHLIDYIGIFGPQRLRVVFFEELTTRPANVLADILQFASLNPDDAQQLRLTKENRSTIHKNKFLTGLAVKMNRNLEPVLNRLPGARRGLRKLYSLLNEGGRQDPTTEPLILDQVKDYYRPLNSDLKSLLSSHSLCDESQKPEWLIRSN